MTRVKTHVAPFDILLQRIEGRSQYRSRTEPRYTQTGKALRGIRPCSHNGRVAGHEKGIRPVVPSGHNNDLYECEVTTDHDPAEPRTSGSRISSLRYLP